MKAKPKKTGSVSATEHNNCIHTCFYHSHLFVPFTPVCTIHTCLYHSHLFVPFPSLMRVSQCIKRIDEIPDNALTGCQLQQLAEPAMQKCRGAYTQSGGINWQHISFMEKDNQTRSDLLDIDCCKSRWSSEKEAPPCSCLDCCFQVVWAKRTGQYSLWGCTVARFRSSGMRAGPSAPEPSRDSTWLIQGSSARRGRAAQPLHWQGEGDEGVEEGTYAYTIEPTPLERERMASSPHCTYCERQGSLLPHQSF